MTKVNLIQIARTYKNNGQHAEQIARYTLGGKIEKADNKPAESGGDYGDIQIKSARATICKGTDIIKGLEKDGAKSYAYVRKDFEYMYLMTKAEFIEFVSEFGTITRDSQKNGGQTKIRLKSEGRAMLEWLERKAA